MYNFDLLNEEKIIYIAKEVYLKKEGTPHLITVVVTNERIIFLDYPDKNFNYEEDLRIARGMDYLKQKEEIYSNYLLNIETIIEEKEYNKYVLKDSNFFYLFDKENKIKDYIKECK